MGLFDFLRKFGFFKGRDVTDLKEEDLDFAKWVAAHRDWRRRLTSFVDGNSQEALDETVICLDNRCDLGKWIHANGIKFYGELPVFQQLVKDHAAFHQCAGHVVQLYKTQGEPPARKALNSDFDTYSLKVVSGLNNLERQVKN